jgi:hypothetical protein
MSIAMTVKKRTRAYLNRPSELAAASSFSLWASVTLYGIRHGNVIDDRPYDALPRGLLGLDGEELGVVADEAAEWGVWSEWISRGLSRRGDGEGLVEADRELGACRWLASEREDRTDLRVSVAGPERIWAAERFCARKVCAGSSLSLGLFLPYWTRGGKSGE